MEMLIIIIISLINTITRRNYNIGTKENTNKLFHDLFINFDNFAHLIFSYDID